MTTDLTQLTPMMRQYHELRIAAGDAVLFFRMGDFYEIFGDDALLVAPVLEIALTSREKDKDGAKIPFCGVPHHSIRAYVQKLLSLGHKVAIADQVESPAEAKGIVKREIVKILTPGCTDDFEFADGGSGQYLAAAYEDPGSRKYAFLLLDYGVGELRLGAVESAAEVMQLLVKFNPRELLLRRFQKQAYAEALKNTVLKDRLILSELPEDALRDDKSQRQALQGLFGKGKTADLPCGDVPGGAALLAAALSYIKHLGLSTRHLISVRPLTPPRSMLLDGSVIRDLELFETARRRDSVGSFFSVVDQTATTMGRRLLRDWILQPLTDQDLIKERADCVEAMVRMPEEAFTAAREGMRGVPDLQKLAARLFNRSCKPGDLGSVRRGLAEARRSLGILEKHVGIPCFLRRLPVLAHSLDLEQVLAHALAPDPQPLGNGRGVFRRGFDDDLDGLVAILDNSEQALRDFEANERQKTGIASLKIKSHKTFGYLIEVTRSNLAKVPRHYVRRQTMVGNERFVTEELMELGEKIDNADLRTSDRELRLFEQLLDAAAPHAGHVREIAAFLAEADVLLAFAQKARTGGYVRPLASPEAEVLLRDSRHPVIEEIIGRHRFTANDIIIKDGIRQLLITGPNMAGKSTVMRQLALIAIMHQIGCFVPASAASMPVFDRIFTRVGASDDLALGQSTFMIEMSEAATVLREATRSSLVILDEVGRGTSTYDGLAIASAIFEDIVHRIGSVTLFATHYHELVPMHGGSPGVAAMQVEVQQDGHQVQFTHRFLPGAAGHSYGIEVAKLAGVPTAVIARAQHLLQSFGKDSKTAGIPSSAEDRASPANEKASAAEFPRETQRHGSRRNPPTALTSDPTINLAGQSAVGREAVSQPLALPAKPALTTDLQMSVRLREQLIKLNINRLTPMKALNLLATWQESMIRTAAGGQGQASLFPEIFDH